MLNAYLKEFFGGNPASWMALLETAVAQSSEALEAMLRLAINRSPASFLQWVRLQNLWNGLGRPMLKPNPIRRRVLFLTDGTADGFPPHIALAAAAYGIDAQITIPPFDSVEHVVLSSPTTANSDVIILILSEDWLKRRLGTPGLVSGARVEEVESEVIGLLSALRDRTTADILVANFAPSAYPVPAPTVRSGDHIGWSLAIGRLNTALANARVPRCEILDVADALFGSTGRAALGRTSFVRARIPYEPPGAIAVSRLIAAALASLSGKAHRALITDLDNTLWGGEIAELGATGIICGPDSPDALGYLLLQEQIKSLACTGVLLGAVSRNDPAVPGTLAQNQQVVLRPNDFAFMQVSWEPKSEAIGSAAEALGFGPEFMVFVDDSLFELGEVLRTHPAIDVVLAGPDPLRTLERLGDGFYFHAVSLTDDDVERTRRAHALRDQQERRSAFRSIDDFLRDIRIRLRARPLDVSTADRIVQLLLKTNQFNLTTRRHNRAELDLMASRGAQIWAFDYEDAFGPQGLISVVILVPEDATVRIDTWLMSCRVLNRTVEEAVFEQILAFARGRAVIGEYIATEKNSLVKDLYAQLGFEFSGPGTTPRSEIWTFDSSRTEQQPRHHVTVATD